MAKRPSPRGAAKKLTSHKKRTLSSRRWLERQISDPYVIEARRQGYRSRAAFKLTELDDKHHLLFPGARVVDLGAAPGGWTQVAVKRVRGAEGGGPGRVIAVDTAATDPVAGAVMLRLDVETEEAVEAVQAALGGPADVVLSDMAPAASGTPAVDHLRIMALAEAAFEVACELLAADGAFVCKVWQGGTEGALLAAMKRRFASVRHAKPNASRKESAETYVVAQGFRGDVAEKKSPPR